MVYVPNADYQNSTKNNTMATVNFDKKLLKELKRKYTNAKKENLETFEFANQPLLTGYAKYLIEYLETKLK